VGGCVVPDPQYKASRLYAPADALFWLAAIIEKMGEIVHGWVTRRIVARERTDA